MVAPSQPSIATQPAAPDDSAHQPEDEVVVGSGAGSGGAAAAASLPPAAPVARDGRGALQRLPERTSDDVADVTGASLPATPLMACLDGGAAAAELVAQPPPLLVDGRKPEAVMPPGTASVGTQVVAVDGNLAEPQHDEHDERGGAQGGPLVEERESAECSKPAGSAVAA